MCSHQFNFSSKTQRKTPHHLLDRLSPTDNNKKKKKKDESFTFRLNFCQTVKQTAPESRLVSRWFKFIINQRKDSFITFKLIRLFIFRDSNFLLVSSCNDSINRFRCVDAKGQKWKLITTVNRSGNENKFQILNQDWWVIKAGFVQYVQKWQGKKLNSLFLR